MTPQKLTHAERLAQGWTEHWGIHDEDMGWLTSTPNCYASWQLKPQDPRREFGSRSATKQWLRCYRRSRTQVAANAKPRRFWRRKKPNPAPEAQATAFEFGQWVVLRGACKLEPFKIALIAHPRVWATDVGVNQRQLFASVNELAPMPPGAVPLQAGDVVEVAKVPDGFEGRRGRVAESVGSHSFPIVVRFDGVDRNRYYSQQELRLIRRDGPEKSGTVSVELGQSVKIADTPPVSPMRVGGIESTGGFRVGDTVQFNNGDGVCEPFTVVAMNGSWPGRTHARFYPPSQCVLINRGPTEPLKVGDRVSVELQVWGAAAKERTIWLRLPGSQKKPHETLDFFIRPSRLRKIP